MAISEETERAGAGVAPKALIARQLEAARDSHRDGFATNSVGGRGYVPSQRLGGRIECS